MHIGKLILAGLFTFGISATAAFAADTQPVAFLDGAQPKDLADAHPVAPVETAALDDSALADICAGQSVNNTINTATQNLSANSNGSTITAGSVVSGAVSFADNAFQGFDGISNVVVNTGNNNIIQGSLQVYMAATPTP